MRYFHYICDSHKYSDILIKINQINYHIYIHSPKYYEYQGMRFQNSVSLLKTVIKLFTLFYYLQRMILISFKFLLRTKNFKFYSMKLLSNMFIVRVVVYLLGSVDFIFLSATWLALPWTIFRGLVFW